MKVIEQDSEFNQHTYETNNTKKKTKKNLIKIKYSQKVILLKLNKINEINMLSGHWKVGHIKFNIETSVSFKISFFNLKFWQNILFILYNSNFISLFILILKTC